MTLLEIVYTETGRDGEFGPKLTFSNTDIVYRMGWAIDTVVTPILKRQITTLRMQLALPP